MPEGKKCLEQKYWLPAVKENIMIASISVSRDRFSHSMHIPRIQVYLPSKPNVSRFQVDLERRCHSDRGERQKLFMQLKVTKL